MTYAFLINILHIVEILIIVGLILLISTKGKKIPANYHFLAILFFAAVWITGNYLVNISTQINTNLVLYWTRYSVVGPALMAPFFVLFALQFRSKNAFTFSIWSLTALFSPSILIILFAQTPYNIIAAEIIDSQQNISTFNPGFLYYLFLLYFIGCFCLFSYILLNKIHASNENKERQILKLIFGAFLSTISLTLITSVILPIVGITTTVTIAPLFIIIFLLITAYAILAYQLFDIRVVIARTIIYTSLLAMIMAVYGLTVYLFASLFGNQGNSNLAASLVTTTILAFSFDPLKNWIANKTDGWLYKKEYEQQEVTRILSEKLSNVVGLDEGLDVVMHQLTDTLHLSHAVTYVFQTGEFGKPEVKRSRDVGYANPTAITLEEHDLLVDYFSQHGAILSIPQLEQQISMEEEAIAHNRIAELNQNRSSFLREHAVKKTVLEKLKKLEASVALPLQLHLQQPLKSV